jgi:hypothetical protein
MSLGCAAAFAGVYLVAVRTSAGQRLDNRAFQVLYSLAPPGTVPVLASFARGVVIAVLATLVVVLAFAAVGRSAWRAVTTSILIVGLAVLSTTGLRDSVLTRPRLSDEAFPQNSLPSTHASVACALVVAAMMLWPPPRPWWLVNAGGVVVLLACLGNVLGQAHRFSDVVASVALVAAISFASLAVVGRPRTWSQPGRGASPR